MSLRTELKKTRFWVALGALVATASGLAAAPAGGWLWLYKVLGAFWAAGPPLWFFWDWHQFKESHKLEGKEFEEFKLETERAKDVWLGFLAALAIIYWKGG